MIKNQINRFFRRAKKICLQPAFLFGRSSGFIVGKVVSHPAREYCADPEWETRIEPVYGGGKGVVTIISDDGDFKTGIYLDQLTRHYLIPVTIGGTVTNIGLQLHWWKQTIQNNPYLELVNHSYNHIRMGEKSWISNRKLLLRHEILHSARWFETRFRSKQICFVCPENDMCDEGYSLLRECGVLAVRRGTRGYNKLYPDDGIGAGDLYNLKCFGVLDVSGERATEERDSWLDTAINEHKWLIEMWHNVDKKDDGGYQTILLEDAKAHLSAIRKYIDSGDLWCAKLTDVIKYALEMKAASISVLVEGEVPEVLVELNGLDANYFNQPLTVCVKVPDSVASIHKNQLIEKDGSYWAQVDVVPGIPQRLLS